MLEYSFAFEIVRNKSIKISGITYYEWGEVEEEIGIFSFDKVIYKHRWGEFLAVKKPRRSRIWGDYRFHRDIVKLVYLNVILDDGGIECWLLTEDWGKKVIERLEKQEEEKQEVLERFRKRMREYEEEFFGGKRVKSYIWQQLLHFELVERMNAPNALIVSYLEPIRRYFKPSQLIIDLSTGTVETKP
jgi:uncharacterized protein (UPF0335 family)